VPFAALAEPDLKNSVPLVARHEVVSLPSASVLSVLRRERTDRRPASKTLVVLADPVFDADDERVASASPRPRARPEALQADLARSVRDVEAEGGPVRLPRLPFTRREAKALLALVPADARKEAFDFDANLPTALSPDLGTYRFVHFATHGFLNSLH